MKGQFMLISSIVIGIIVISTATTISQIQNQDLNTREVSNTAEIIRDEAEKVSDDPSQQEINNFKQMVSMISNYQTRTQHWDRSSQADCFNVTLRTSSQEAKLNCIS